MAAGAWHRGSIHSWLLFPRLPCVFGHPLLLCLQPVCCFTLRQCGIASSFVSLVLAVAAVMCRRAAVICFIILIPVTDLFLQSVEYLCFGWLGNDELHQQAMFILLMRFYSIKRLGSVTFSRCTLKERLDRNNGWDDKMGWCGCLIMCKDRVETIKDNHTAVPSCTSFNSVTMKEW